MDIATISFLTLMETERQKKQQEEERLRREQEEDELRKLEEQTSNNLFYDAWAEILAKRAAKNK